MNKLPKVYTTKVLAPFGWLVRVYGREAGSRALDSLEIINGKPFVCACYFAGAHVTARVKK